MHTRRIAGFLLGAWMMGCIFMAFVGAESFRGVDKILKSPPAEAAKMLQAIGFEQGRVLLRFEAAEQNRAISETWEWTQMGLGAALLLAVFVGTRGNKFALIFVAGMLVALCFQRFLVTPEIEWVGRAIDFAPADAATTQRDRLSVVTSAYWAIEALKLLLGALLGAYLFVFKTKLQGKLRPDTDSFDLRRTRSAHR